VAGGLVYILADNPNRKKSASLIIGALMEYQTSTIKT
jgi:hypothetical protein